MSKKNTTDNQALPEIQGDSKSFEEVNFWGGAELMIPFSEPLNRYPAGGKFDLKPTLEQQRCFWRIHKALYDNNCKLRNGRHVNTFADTLRYVLERIEDGVCDFERARSK